MIIFDHELNNQVTTITNKKRIYNFIYIFFRFTYAKQKPGLPQQSGF
jgi:hypothetical protein